MKFGEFIRCKREEAGWTQPEAAQRADIEQSYLSKLETGRSYPSEEVYQRLIEAYGLATADLVEQVDGTEIERLREVQSVRAEVLGRAHKALNLARGWMLAGLAALVLGGASIGTAITAEHDEYMEYFYRSQGVLTESEALDSFSIVSMPYFNLDRATQEADQAWMQAHNEQLSEMLTRLDTRELVLRGTRGDAFVQPVEGGRRYFELVDTRLRSVVSPLRWFMVPGLALILGSFGCFFLGFRWK